jgi:hypothetical protein
LREVNEILLNNKIVLKRIQDITPKTRKKIKVFLGTDVKDYFILIVKIDKKSRFVMKDAKELIDFVEALTEINFKHKKRVLILSGEICSKSKQFLKNWRIIK